MNKPSLQSHHLADLHKLASELEIERFRMLTRDELVDAITEKDPDASPAAEPATEKKDGRSKSEDGRSKKRDGSSGKKDGASGKKEDGGQDEGEPIEGLLEITSRGHGFIRLEGLQRGDDDVYVSPSQIRRCELRSGDHLAGPARPARRGERHSALVHVDRVNGSEPGEERSGFEDLTPVPPTRRLPLDGEGASGPDEAILLRSVDLLAPLARGQRVLIDAAAGSGRTTLLRALGRAFTKVDDLELSILLIDERPEEEQRWREQLPDASIAAAGADMRAGEQLGVVELALARAARRAAEGADVVLLVDSLSRLGVAADDPSSAKPIFATGRETKEDDAGSLTVIATTIDRDEDRGVAKMLSSTENASIKLDPELAAAGVWPAIEVGGCRTAGEDGLREGPELAGSRALRAELAALPARDAAERLRERLGAAATNDSLLASLAD